MYKSKFSEKGFRISGKEVLRVIVQTLVQCLRLSLALSRGTSSYIQTIME
jgi:hypothetical protein